MVSIQDPSKSKLYPTEVINGVKITNTTGQKGHGARIFAWKGSIRKSSSVPNQRLQSERINSTVRLIKWPAAEPESLPPTAKGQAMAWNIFYRSNCHSGCVIVRQEDEYLPEGFNFVREATEAEVDDEQKRREAKGLSHHCNQSH
jgi:hypothetical protein